MTTFFVDQPLANDATVSLSEAAAHHARVKRMAVGDAVRVTNGAGVAGRGTIARIGKAEVAVRVHDVAAVPAPSPLELFAPVGDRDRMLWLAEKATELGITAWRPVVFKRSQSVSPRGEGEAFAGKVRARMIGALEQSGSAWLPVVHREIRVDEAASLDLPHARYLLDPAGGPLPRTRGDRRAAVILGPEGGLEPSEREQLVAAGWAPVSLAPNVLRFETAGIAAIAVLRAAQVTTSGDSDG